MRCSGRWRGGERTGRQMFTITHARTSHIRREGASELSLTRRIPQESKRKGGRKKTPASPWWEAALHHCHAVTLAPQPLQLLTGGRWRRRRLNVLGGARRVDIRSRFFPPPCDAPAAALVIFSFFSFFSFFFLNDFYSYTRSKSEGPAEETHTAYWRCATLRVYMAAIRTEPVLLR